MIKAIVIDDDQRARKALIKLIDPKTQGIEICAEGKGVEDSIQLISDFKPQLIFLDIRLKGGTGFDILKSISRPFPSVIFTTAYSEFAIKAIKYAALDYLLKPIDPLELNDAIEKYKKTKEESIDSRLEVLESFMNSSTIDSRKIVLTDASGFKIVSLNNVEYCEGEKNYTTFHLIDGSKVVTSKSLIEYERILDEDLFLRVHKSFIIGLSHVKAFQKGRDSNAVMTSGALVSISREKKDLFLSLLSKRLK